MKRILTLCLFGAALLAAVTPARAERDVVHFGSNIHVPSGSAVHDAVCFFCSVDAEGDVEGNLVVFFGSVHLNASAHHDVVNFFGSIAAEDNASVGNNLVSMFGGIHLGENVSVGHDLVSIFGGVHAPESVVVGNNRVVQPFWLAGVPGILVFVVIVVLIHELRGRRRRNFPSGYPFPPGR